MLSDDRRYPPNRRQHERYPVSLMVRFASEMLVFDGEAEFEGAVENISRGGVFIRSDFLETPGTAVQLWVIVPRSESPLALVGQVAWISEKPPRGPGMGICFAGPLDEKVLNRLVALGSRV